MAGKPLTVDERVEQFLKEIELKPGIENKKLFILGKLKDIKEGLKTENYELLDAIYLNHLSKIESVFTGHPEIIKEVTISLDACLNHLYGKVLEDQELRRRQREGEPETEITAKKTDFDELDMGMDEKPAKKIETSKFTIPDGLKEKQAGIDGTILGLPGRNIEKAEKAAQPRVIMMKDYRKKPESAVEEPEDLSTPLSRELSSYSGSFLGECIVKFEEQRSAKQITKEKILTDPELLLGYISQIWLGELEKGAIKLKSALIAYRNVLGVEKIYKEDRCKTEEVANLRKEINERISGRIKNDSLRKEVCDPGKIKNEYLDNLINDYQQAASLEKEENGLKEIREKIGETIMAKINDDITTPFETIKNFYNILKHEKGDLTTTSWMNKLKLDAQFVYKVIELDEKGQKKENGGQNDEKIDTDFGYGLG